MSRPFILLASSRKGTHLLLTALHGHPEVVVHDQPLSDPNFYPAHTGEELAIRLFDGPQPVAVLGLAWTSARDRYRGFWDELVKRNVGVIYLHRKNMLQWHLSCLIAQHTGQWMALKPVTNATLQLTVNPTDAEWTIQTDWHHERLACAFFRSHLSVHVWYESIASLFDAQMAVIQRFLGVKELPLRPTCYKQQQRPLREVIGNFSELMFTWAGTPWELLLRDAIPSEVPPATGSGQ